MSEQRQRSERRIHMSPYYRHGAWENFQDWPSSRLFDQVGPLKIISIKVVFLLSPHVLK